MKRETPTHCFDRYYAPPLSMYSNMLVQAPPVSCSSPRISVIPSRPCWACLAGVPGLLHTTLFTAPHQRAVTCRDLTVVSTSSCSIFVLGRAKTLPSERGQWTHRHPPKCCYWRLFMRLTAYYLHSTIISSVLLLTWFFHTWPLTS